MNRWPWIGLSLAALAVLNPLGLDVICAAFFSGESLSRAIWQPIVAAAALVFLALTALNGGCANGARRAGALDRQVCL